MPQSQLSELARQVLRVSEKRFRELVRELAKKALLVGHYDRRNWLSAVGIVLGNAGRGIRKYEVVVESPFCRERFGNGRGVFGVSAFGVFLFLEYRCVADHIGTGSTSVNTANIQGDGWVETFPWRLYELYNFLYKELGIGARPLLELARRAEEEGDKELAGVLRRVYAILEASKDMIDEIERADYSSVFEGEIEKKVEEAVGLLRRAKELAARGDNRGVFSVGISKVIEAPRHTIYLVDIIRYLDIGEGSRVEDLLSYGPKDLSEILREEDIYDVFITVAEHFGLEVRR